MEEPSQFGVAATCIARVDFALVLLPSAARRMYQSVARGVDHHESIPDERIASAQGGCEDSLRQLVEELYPRVRGLVRLHLPRGEEASDLCQDSLVKVVRRIGQFRGRGEQFWSWVSQIVVRTCIDRLRYCQRRPSVCWSDLSSEQHSMLEGWCDRSADHGQRDIDAAEFLDQLIGGLGAKDRLVIRLIELEGQTPSEVAEITGWSPTLVRVRAHRARKRLQKLYRELEPND